MHRYRSAQRFDPSAGPWPTRYSAEELKQQRDAGQAALTEFHRSLANGEREFEFEPGVYRVHTCFEADGIDGLHIRAPNVEIINESKEWSAHFRILGCKNLSITGPLILDASPFGFSQGTVVDTELHKDGPSYVVIEPHEGYPFPVKGHRICCFKPDTGVLIAHYQDPVQAVEQLPGNRIRLTFNQDFMQLYGLETAAAVKPGNLMCLENTEALRGGFEIRDTTGLEILDVSMHCFALTWALPLSGNVTIRRFQGCRRPHTNRLMGGGFFAFGMFGGSCTIDDCELGHNFDDLTDIGSELGFSFRQVAPNQVYVGMTNDPPVPGRTYVFYNAYTLELTGQATVVASEKATDSSVVHAFWEELKKASVLTWDCVPYLVTLDQDIEISRLELVDCTQARPESLSITNSYLHDSLAAGISLKGAKKIHIEGNVIERAGYRAIGAGFDPYWWEGGIPSGITIIRNHIIDTPYNLPDLTPAINIYVDAAPSMLEQARGRPMQGIQIAHNTIINARTAAIGAAYARDVTIADNTIQNPMAAGLQTAWGNVCCYQHPAAILLDAVENVSVHGNTISTAHPQLIPDMICVTGKTDEAQIRLADNQLVLPTGGPTPLPSSFFTKVSCCTSAVGLHGDWRQQDVPGCFSGRRLESSAPGASATFTWRGSRARVYGTLRRGLGLADVLLDGEAVTFVDSAVLPASFAKLIGEAELHDQLIIDTGPLAPRKHELSVVVRDRFAPDEGVGIALEAFDFLDDSPAPHAT